MSKLLPRLRADLDLMPSPLPEQPGVLIRDPFRYSDAVLVVPPSLLAVVDLFDGVHTDLDLRGELTRITGEIAVSEVLENLWNSLSDAGFLEDDRYGEMKDLRRKEFAALPVRPAEHAGSAYPDTRPELDEVLNQYLTDGLKPELAAGPSGRLMGIAAPHVSPFGGWKSYQAAYARLPSSLAGRTFVVLGTSHYGIPEKFGLTRKAFETPLGRTQTRLDLVDELERRAGKAVLMEDYCHAIEHSIEFQVLFLQWVFGPEIRVLPILCGSYARSIYLGGRPEDDEGAGQFLDVLGDVAAREGDRLFWVLGIDMAHIGRRYGDRFSAIADEDGMIRVAERDRKRLDAICAGDRRGFWDQVQEKRDDLRWCGSAPLYTFLHAVRPGRGTVERYEQWNIDEHSVVSFAGVHFEAGA